LTTSKHPSSNQTGTGRKKPEASKDDDSSDLFENPNTKMSNIRINSNLDSKFEIFKEAAE